MTEPTVRVRFLPADRTIEVEEGAWLAAAAVRAGIGIVFDCDGQGVCATCRVRIEAGAEAVGPVAEAERIQLGDAVEKGMRLSCLLRVHGDVTVQLPQSGFAYPPELQR